MTFVYYGTRVAIISVFINTVGIIRIAVLRLSGRIGGKKQSFSLLCLLKVTPLFSSVLFGQHLSAQNFDPIPKPNLKQPACCPVRQPEHVGS